MIDLNSTSLVPHWARRDPLRNENTVKARAKLRMNYAVGDTVLQPKKAGPDGWLYFECYESEFRRMSEDVETNLPGIAAAEQANAKRLRNSVAAKYQLPELGVDPATWPEEARRELARWPGSTEAEFYHANLRGILPVIAIELLETMAPPKTNDQSAIANAVQAAVTAALEAVNKAPAAPAVTPKAK